MPSIYNFNEFEIIAFSLVLIRISGFVVSWPVFGVANVPSTAKVLFALVTAILVFPILDVSGVKTHVNSNALYWLAAKEAFIGVSIGFLCRMFFFAVSVGGQLVGLSMGLASAQLLNPSLGSRGNAVEQFQVVLATLFFLAINGHHWFLKGLIQSFEIVPVSQLGVQLSAFGEAALIGQAILVIGIKLCAPVMISILFLNMAMGIVGRAVPQINVLITSLPINILAGFAVMILAVPLFVGQMGELLEEMTMEVFKFMRAF